MSIIKNYQSFISLIEKILFRSTEIYSLVFTRILFGAIMFWEMTRYFSHGWIERYYIRPEFFFKYYGFSWVKVWSGDLIYIHFIILGILALMIMVGFFYRFAIIAFLIGFSYIYLLDQSNYLNHFYMVILFNFLLCFMPAHHYFSLDAKLRPKIKSTHINFWSVFLLRSQLEIILIYAGIVKINHDWLNLQPLKMWLSSRADYFLIGNLFTNDLAITIAVYGVILLHIIGAPLLLLKKTRIYIFIIYCCFHILNAWVFSIGIFPWLTIALTLICFDTNWPLRLKQYLFRESKILTHFSNKDIKSSSLTKKKIIVLLIAIWVSIQILIPLRHYIYPGNVAWTQEGHRFAWRMKLRSIKGYSKFTAINNKEIIKINNTTYLTSRQAKKMSCKPDMILQFAHHLHDVFQKKGIKDIQIYSKTKCSLNGRKRSLLIDPNIDLTRVKRNLKPANWILHSYE